MTQSQFIKEIAKYVQKYAPQFGIKVCSPIIAQAILESASGTSELAVNACNYFGLKYRKNRCPSACGIYVKKGSEQNADGSYVTSVMQWMKFSNLELGVKGYFEFINVSNYKLLKGISNPKEYLTTIKACGYATSLKYVDNLLAVIQKYNLTQYDTISSDHEEGGNKMVINVHAGHNPDGKPACGAIGLIKESTEARKVKDAVIKMLKAQGHTVYDCTVDNGTSQSDVLKKIVSKCNEHNADLDVSIHFNAGASKIFDKKTTGTEVLVYSTASKSYQYAQKIVNAISALGFKNRGVKTSKSLYFLKNTKNPSLLVECCFVDDPDDVELYNTEKMAQAIVKGITGIAPLISTNSTSSNINVNENTASSRKLYRVQTGAYSIEKNALTLQGKLINKGFNAVVVKVGTLYKVQVGAYSKKENAEAMVTKLKKKGFNSIIT